MRKPTKALVAVLLIGAVSVNADVVRTRGGGSGGAASAVTPGTTTVTGCQNRILYGDNSSILNCEAALGYVASTDTATVPNLTVSTALTNTALTSGRVPIASTGGLFADDADLTFSGTRLTATDLTVTNMPTFSAATAGRIRYSGTAGILADEAGFEYDATNNQLLIPDGTSTVPSFSFAADTNTGFYRSGSDIWNEIYGGARTTVHASTQVGYLTTYQVGWYSGSFAAFDTGLTRNGAAGVIRATDGASGIRGFMGGGAAVASATALPVPTGRVFHVTGTTNITSITSTNFQSGTVITIIFDGILTFTDGNNIVLNTVLGNYVTTADDTITLVYDGTNWYETSRSAN